jgi:hypothetical protein
MAARRKARLELNPPAPLTGNALVIPAQAGIQSPSFRRKLESNHRHSGAGRNPAIVIPAQAGIQ